MSEPTPFQIEIQRHLEDKAALQATLAHKRQVLDEAIAASREGQEEKLSAKAQKDREKWATAMKAQHQAGMQSARSSMAVADLEQLHRKLITKMRKALAVLENVQGLQEAEREDRMALWDHGEQKDRIQGTLAQFKAMADDLCSTVLHLTRPLPETSWIVCQHCKRICMQRFVDPRYLPLYHGIEELAFYCISCRTVNDAIKPDMPADLPRGFWDSHKFGDTYISKGNGHG